MYSRQIPGQCLKLGRDLSIVPSFRLIEVYVKGGSNMTGTDLYVNNPHCAAAVRP